MARFEIAIREYLHILKKRRLLVILSASLMAILGMVLYELSALMPSYVFNPPKVLTAGIAGLIAGIVLGLILVPVVESFSSSLRAIRAVEEIAGKQVLGNIPLADNREIISYLTVRSPDTANRSSSSDIIGLVTHYAPSASTSEGFRILRTNILSSGRENRIKSVVIASAAPGEGRTLASVNLAISMAQAGLKTLLVEADLRRPTFAKILGIEELTGLTDIILGNFPWRDTVKGVTDIIMGKISMDDVMLTPGLDNLHIITSGGRPLNPAEMIGSKGYADFLKEAKKEYDFVIIDTPPILPSADAGIAGGKADAVVMIHRMAAVSGNYLKRAVVRLEQAKCNLIGVVLNGTRPEIEIKPPYYDNRLHKGLTFLNGKGEKTKEDRSEDEGRKSSIIFRGAIALGAIILIAIAVWYWGGSHVVEKRSEVIKTPAKAEIVSAPIKSKEAPTEAKVPAPTQIQSPAQKAPIQQPVAKAVEPQIGTSIQENAYQQGGFPFSVYIGSFKTRKKAEETVAANKQHGIDGFWVKITNEDIGTWYRIYAGWFKDRGQAESFIHGHDFDEAEIKETVYANLVGSFKSFDEINIKAQSLEKAGYSTYIIKVADGIYNLFTGAYMTEGGAEEQNRELKSNGIISSVVKR